jgi:predicted transcriptional regulator
MPQKTKKKTKQFNFRITEDILSLKSQKNKKNSSSFDVKTLRSMLSREKLRIILFLKNNEVNSMYDLSKKLDRDFRAVRDDVKVLESMNILELQKRKVGKRKSNVPRISVNKIQITINI